MSGILFCRTANLEAVSRFYTERIGMEVWLRQPDVVILKHGNFLLGLHQKGEPDTGGLITFFYPTHSEVDAVHRDLHELATTRPEHNGAYHIYHFFARDPEGRALEFQSFESPVPPHMGGEELIRSRRSVRRFEPRPVDGPMLERVLAACVCAPSARNSQAWHYVIVRDRQKLETLARMRGDSSAPIAAAPMAVAICADPQGTSRAAEDGCIAAYHFLLVAWLHGLGTCWIGGMDCEDVKDILGIPREHYVATITPLGFPAERPEMRPRRPIRVSSAA